MLESLKAEVCAANRALPGSGLVRLTWGNVSGIDRTSGLWVIKPSGVDYEDLTPEAMVVLDLEGRVVEGSLRPSSDTRTHLHLYREFERIGGITHTHSPYATAFSQAGRELPCLGTTHADHFYGTVPVVRAHSLANSIALEMCAQMALATLALSPGLGPMPQHLLDKHHLRKHGPGAYYGQK